MILGVISVNQVDLKTISCKEKIKVMKERRDEKLVRNWKSDSHCISKKFLDFLAINIKRKSNFAGAAVTENYFWLSKTEILW